MVAPKRAAAFRKSIKPVVFRRDDDAMPERDARSNSADYTLLAGYPSFAFLVDKVRGVFLRGVRKRN